MDLEYVLNKSVSKSAMTTWKMSRDKIVSAFKSSGRRKRQMIKKGLASK